MNAADRDAPIASARRIGVDPVDYGTVIFYETGGTFSPAIRRGAGNRHIGLIQFGIPEQRQYGTNQDQSFAEQRPAVERDLVDRGFEPGMGILDIPGAYLRACGQAGALPKPLPPATRGGRFCRRFCRPNCRPLSEPGASC